MGDVWFDVCQTVTFVYCVETAKDMTSNANRKPYTNIRMISWPLSYKVSTTDTVARPAAFLRQLSFLLFARSRVDYCRKLARFSQDAYGWIELTTESVVDTTTTIKDVQRTGSATPWWSPTQIRLPSILNYGSGARAPALPWRSRTWPDVKRRRRRVGCTEPHRRRRHPIQRRTNRRQIKLLKYDSSLGAQCSSAILAASAPN